MKIAEAALQEFRLSPRSGFADRTHTFKGAAAERRDENGRV